MGMVASANQYISNKKGSSEQLQDKLGQSGSRSSTVTSVGNLEMYVVDALLNLLQ